MGKSVASVGLPESYLLPFSAVTAAYYSPRGGRGRCWRERNTDGFLQREATELKFGMEGDACGIAQSPSSFFRNADAVAALAAMTSIFDSLCDR